MSKSQSIKSGLVHLNEELGSFCNSLFIDNDCYPNNLHTTSICKTNLHKSVKITNSQTKSFKMCVGVHQNVSHFCGFRKEPWLKIFDE